MKKSIYNIVQKVNDTHYVVYNSLSATIRLLTSEQFSSFESGKELSFYPFCTEVSVNEMECAQQERDFYINSKKDYIRFTILPTLKCNANCVFCFENIQKRNDMSQEDVKQTISYIKSEAINYKKLRIHWFGGEPLVALPTIFRITNELYEFCRNNHISYRACISTNLSLINDDNYKRIINDLHLDTVEFAFDGNETQHNTVKAYRDKSFDAFNHNIHMLEPLLKKNISVSVRFNGTKSNFPDILGLANTLCERYGMYPNFHPYLAVIVPTSKYEDSPDLIHPEEYASYYIPFFRVLQKNGAGMEVYPLNRNKNFCYGSNPNSIVIGSNGLLTKCIASPSLPSLSIGTIRTGVQKNEAYDKWIYYSIKDECPFCTLFPLCLGGCINDHIFKSISPCKKEKYYISELLREAGKFMLKNNIEEYIFK